MTRDKVLNQAVDQCLKEIYSYAVPSINWDDFIAENKIYSKKYLEWEDSRKNKSHPEWEGKNITECIGPAPYEFYYLPKEILKSIADSYTSAYRIDTQNELLTTIDILKNYCKKPIVDKYIEDYTDEDGNNHPGHRGYDYPDNLEKEINKIIDNEELSKLICNKFFEFLDMAGNFYSWTRDLSTFNCSVYLGPSPYSIKEKVIENWKKYRGKDIEINEEQIKKEYYGD